MGKAGGIGVQQLARKQNKVPQSSTQDAQHTLPSSNNQKKAHDTNLISAKTDSTKSSDKVNDSETKPPATAGKKRKANEIDDIFGKKPAAKPDAQTVPDVAAASATGAAPAQKLVVEGCKDDLFGEEVVKTRKRTDEGFSIYSEDELGLGKKGGDTDLCPFDCDCCF